MCSISRFSLKYILLFCLGTTICGCQSWLSRENTKQTAQGVSVVHSRSSDQFSYIKQDQALARFCTETDTDVESTSSSGISLGVSGESIGDEHTKGAVTLGGRDPTVLITRELMFRACELILNTNAKAPNAVKIYANTLDALYEIIKIHKGAGTASVSAKPTNPAQLGDDTKDKQTGDAK